jgi:hypothetical protein
LLSGVDPPLGVDGADVAVFVDGVSASEEEQVAGWMGWRRQSTGWP